MKLKNRIIVGFMMVILVPLLLFAAALFGISETQHRNAANNESAQETSYDITISDTGSSQARIQIMTKDLFFTDQNPIHIKNHCFYHSYIHRRFCGAVDLQKCGGTAGQTAKGDAEYQGRKSGFCSGCRGNR